MIGYFIAYNLFVSNIFSVDMSCKMLFFHLESLGCIQYIPHLLRALSSLPPTNSPFSSQQVLQSIHPACAQNTFRSHHHLPQYCLNCNVPTWQYEIIWYNMMFPHGNIYLLVMLLASTMFSLAAWIKQTLV